MYSCRQISGLNAFSWSLHSEQSKNVGEIKLTAPWQSVQYHFNKSYFHPHEYSCLESPMDGGAWKAAVHGVAKSRTWLSNFIFTFHFHALEKEMATHPSVLAWRIPGTAEPGGLPSMGSHRVEHDWSDLAAAAVLLSRDTTWSRPSGTFCCIFQIRGHHHYKNNSQNFRLLDTTEA